ncbi:MAG TPA: hypothetical protein VM597_22620 [Gemmataceae bacterium]|jgi:hypothetical protein|nr:hypothetical protein [Gemmataceae bacterium]
MWNRPLGQPIAVVGIAVAVAVAVALLGPSATAVDDVADAVTRRTADVAVACWFAAVALILTDRRPWARAFWVCGGGAFLVHVATAFDQIHNWSHDAAFDHVKDVSGFGPGVLVSYGFSLVWTADALWWWASPASYDRRPIWLNRSVQVFIAFVVFNGTVVYETGFIRYAGIVAFVALAALLARQLTHESGSRRAAA